MLWHVPGPNISSCLYNALNIIHLNCILNYISLCLLIKHSHMCLSFCVWEVANEWMWSLRQCSTLYSMYEFRGAGAQPCQPCCLWPQKRCRWDSQCSITNIKLVCSIKLESYLSYCEGVCQSALKIMHCKLEFTELMKCLQGSYDKPLKERALSDNLSNFEKKCFKYVLFFNAANMSFFGIWGWENTGASFLFQSLSLLPGAALLWAGAFLVSIWGCLLLYCGAWWGDWPGAAAPCAEVSAGSSHPLPSIPTPPIALWHVLAVLPALQLTPWQMLSPACV